MPVDTGKTLYGVKDAQWLTLPHIHIRSPEKVLNKINSIIQGGRDKLQVIFDFDRTLTKHHENGVFTLSSFCLLENMPTAPKGFREVHIAAREKYLPIELDPNLTLEQKIPFMVEWWICTVEHLKGMYWDPLIVDKYLRQNRQPFRDGTTECFQQLHDAKVPVLVFSAGIGDVVKPSLDHEGLLTPNVHVVSNFFKFEDGIVTGCVGDIIHVFNKNEQLIQNTPYFEELSGRTNVILLGDSIGDAKMADGVPHETVLKIGFLNTKIEESLGQYKEIFDIVLTDDQTMEVLKHILRLTL